MIAYSVKLREAELDNPFSEIPWQPSVAALNQIAAILRADKKDPDVWMYHVELECRVWIHLKAMSEKASAK